MSSFLSVHILSSFYLNCQDSDNIQPNSVPHLVWMQLHLHWSSWNQTDLGRTRPLDYNVCVVFTVGGRRRRCVCDVEVWLLWVYMHKELQLCLWLQFCQRLTTDINGSSGCWLKTTEGQFEGRKHRVPAVKLASVCLWCVRLFSGSWAHYSHESQSNFDWWLDVVKLLVKDKTIIRTNWCKSLKHNLHPLFTPTPGRTLNSEHLVRLSGASIVLMAYLTSWSSPDSGEAEDAVWRRVTVKASVLAWHCGTF